jgi:acetyl-CoA carboxylase carboxyl transferase subunit alpha
MLENAIYSVISPEGCAGILWRDKAKAPEAAEVMRLTATDIQELGVIDGVVPEPVGGAHRDPATTAREVRRVVKAAFAELSAKDPEALLEERLEKFAAMGVFQDAGAGAGRG